MHTWTVAAVGSSSAMADGSAPALLRAWKDAVNAILDQLRKSDAEAFVIVVDGAPAWLMPGRTEEGLLDETATRAAVERVAAAALGGLL